MKDVKELFETRRNAFLIRQGFLTADEIEEIFIEKGRGRNAFLIRQGFLTERCP